MKYVYTFCWDAFVWGGFAYLVTACGWSPWWAVLALGITVTLGKSNK